MNRILVLGLINIETTLKVDGFPLEYFPVTYPFFGIQSTVSGVGVNVSKALNTLGDEVVLLSMLGDDPFGRMARAELKADGISDKHVLSTLEQTPQSVIIYEEGGRRQIHTDLKDVQDRDYSEHNFSEALKQCSIAVLCNLNCARPFLKTVKAQGKLIATDVHVIKDIYDSYNADFMRHADILFMSNEGIKGQEEEFAKKVIKEYDNEILVVGLGSEGALLYVKKDGFMGRYKAVKTREIINTIGAGDALFSSFIHFYNKTQDPYTSLKKAMVFASYKIGEKGAAQGFLTEQELEKLYKGLC